MAAPVKSSQGQICQAYIFYCLCIAVLGFHSYVIYSLHSLKEEVRADISKLDTSMQQIIKDVKFAQAYCGYGFQDRHVSTTKDAHADSPDIEETVMHNDKNNINATDAQRCNITDAEVLSAIARAKTDFCKRELADIACLNQEGKLYPASLPRSCPFKGIYDKGEYLGCFRDNPAARDVGNFATTFRDENTPQKCIEICINGGYAYAALQFSVECWCGFSYGRYGSLSESACSLSCPGNRSQSCGGYNALRIFSTGLRPVERIRDVALTHHFEEVRAFKPVRIVFGMMISGRAVRQIKRLIKAIYHKDHYYFIHVDKKQDYLYQELLKLQDILPNLRLATNRTSCLWGGNTLLKANLDILKSLLAMTDWSWDYYINLSESAYPIKNINALIDFVRRYQGGNFIKSHNADTYEFIRKQGVNQLFHECENHVWRLGMKKALPSGIVYDGGSDWFGLHREFLEYVVSSNDLLVTGMLEFSKYSFSPLESFFHTVLINSKFCNTVIDINLHIVNWKGSQGCSCLKKRIDYCGCSPANLKSKDFNFIMSHAGYPVFLARKFEAVVCQEIYNSLDRVLGISYSDISKLKLYWQNEFHHMDQTNQDTVTTITFGNSFVRRASEIFERNQQMCDYIDMQLLETHILYESDKFQSYLVKHMLLMPDESICTYESRFTKINRYKREDTRAAGAILQSLEVGSDFDSKEQIFRNYPGFFGPDSKVILRHIWSYGPGKKVAFVWMDPNGRVAAWHNIRIARTRLVQIHSPKLSRPLQDGIWTVKVLIEQKLLGTVSFLIIQIVNQHSVPFSQAEDGVQNVSVNQLSRTDELTANFWKLQETCLINTDKECPVLKLCQNTQWSSASKDQTADIKGVDSNGNLI